jgi:DNA-directed RNA polymerase specialized sigma subunit
MPAMVTETPLDVLIQKQRDDCRERYIKKLPELIGELGSREKLILKMKFFKGFRTSQIARELKISRYEINKCEHALLDFFRKKIREICEK